MASRQLPDGGLRRLALAGLVTGLVLLASGSWLAGLVTYLVIWPALGLVHWFNVDRHRDGYLRRD